jgi:hypothetical protein
VIGFARSIHFGIVSLISLRRLFRFFVAAGLIVHPLSVFTLVPSGDGRDNHLFNLIVQPADYGHRFKLLSNDDI